MAKVDSETSLDRLQALIVAVQSTEGSTIIGGPSLRAAIRLGRGGIPQAEQCTQALSRLDQPTQKRVADLIRVARRVRPKTTKA